MSTKSLTMKNMARKPNMASTLELNATYESGNWATLALTLSRAKTMSVSSTHATTMNRSVTCTLPVFASCTNSLPFLS